jgi:alkaline phosphatase D
MMALTGRFVAFAQDADAEAAKLLQSGPMLGFSDMFEVHLWAQTNAPARVKVIYYETTIATVRYETNEVQTSADKAFTAKFIADKTQPGRKYTYELHINGRNVKRPYPLTFQSQQLWQWRTEPPAMKFCVGSCLYINETIYDRPGRPYGDSYQVLSNITAAKPEFMVWLGDNLYLREPDWNTRTGIFHRYTHTRSTPELQPLLASTHHYAIWDDHDFGPNDSDRGFWNKEQTYEAFKLFWANPCYGVNGRGGVTTQFGWGDAEFFMLDNRSFRSPDNRKTGKRTMIGDEQMEWLIDALVTSRATFKFVAIGGQVLNPVQVYENYSTYAEERSKLLDLIEKEGIKGVIFLTGDRHHTELTKFERKGTYPLYDFTISSFTAGADGRAESEPNTMRVQGTFVGERNYSVFEITGPRKDRVLKCSVYDVNGKEKWTRSVAAKELGY